MKKFEFVLRKVYRQRGIRIFLMFFAFMLPTQTWKVFVELLLFSGLLPRDIERGDDELSLQLPLRKWELFLYEFLSGAIPLLISGLFIMALGAKGDLRWLRLWTLSRSFLTMPYVYALCVLSAKYLKSNFILPFVFMIIDVAFCKTPWRYVSPICQGSFISAIVSLGVFVLAALLYSDIKTFEGAEI